MSRNAGSGLPAAIFEDIGGAGRAAIHGNIRVLDTLVLKAAAIRRATPSARIVRLALDGAHFPFRAGQAAMLGIAPQSADMPYSIASAPEETREQGYLEFLVKLEQGGWPPHLAGLRRGAHVSVRGPIGSFVFPDNPGERHFLFVAGGTGMAPLRAMIWHALYSGQPGSFHLLYSARTPADFAYLPELRRLVREGRLRMALTATREVGVRWRNDRGRITSERLASLIDTPDTLCFVCGPASMVDEVPQMLAQLGIDRKRIRVEEYE